MSIKIVCGEEMKSSIQLLIVVIIFMNVTNSNAQDVFNLWDGETKPYYKDNNLEEYEKELWNTRCVFNITEPTLTVYKAQGINTGKAVIIIPGGGYELVAMYHEGYDLAEVLAKQGITAAVLKYRLPNPESSNQPELVPLTDTRRAFKMVKNMADEYGIKKDEVGVVGFSAGSHLSTVTCLWKSEDDDENPNFAGLIYGVTILSEANLKWLEEKLYYRKMTKEELAQNTLLDLVSPDTPPTFLVHAYDDETCNVEESTLYAERLFENNVQAEMHLFPAGGHGFGMGREGTGTTQWVDLFINWVKSL